MPTRHRRRASRRGKLTERTRFRLGLILLVCLSVGVPWLLTTLLAGRVATWIMSP